MTATGGSRRFDIELNEDGEALRWLVVEKWRHDAATEEDRSAGNPQALDEHQSWTAEKALVLARRVGLDEDYVQMLVCAARLHDEGKQAERWQRAFNAPRGQAYAKTKGPLNLALLDGYRRIRIDSVCENRQRLSEITGGQTRPRPASDRRAPRVCAPHYFHTEL